MKNTSVINVDCCRNCPFYDGSDREIANCTHEKAKKGYDGILSRSHFKPEPVPKWCPIINGGLFVKTNNNGTILSRTKLTLTAKIEK